MIEGCKKNPCTCPSSEEENRIWRKQREQEAIIHKLKTGEDLSMHREGYHMYQWAVCHMGQYLESIGYTQQKHQEFVTRFMQMPDEIRKQRQGKKSP